MIDPLGFSLVQEFKVALVRVVQPNPSGVCMRHGKCTKNYPNKPFRPETLFDPAGYPFLIDVESVQRIVLSSNLN
jgi:hypothetical protein